MSENIKLIGADGEIDVDRSIVKLLNIEPTDGVIRLDTNVKLFNLLQDLDDDDQTIILLNFYAIANHPDVAVYAKLISLYVMPVISDISLDEPINEDLLKQIFLDIIDDSGEEAVCQIVNIVLGSYPTMQMAKDRNMYVPGHNVMADVVNALNDHVEPIKKKKTKIYKYAPDTGCDYRLTVSGDEYTFSKDVADELESVSYSKSSTKWSFGCMDRKWKPYFQSIITKIDNYIVHQTLHRDSHSTVVYSGDNIVCTIKQTDNDHIITEYHEDAICKYDRGMNKVIKIGSNISGVKPMMSKDVINKIIKLKAD